MDFAEILWSAGVWPRDQLNYIYVMIRTTIWIQESVPDHDPVPGRTATLSIMLAFSGGLCSLSTSLRSFVPSLRWLSDFHETWQRCSACSASEPLFIINLSEVKVKVQGRNLRTESFTLVTARLRFKISSHRIWQSNSSNLGMNYRYNF